MYHIVYGSASSVAMISILYGYIYKVRNAPPYLWSLGSGAAPTSAKLLSFGCLSLGLGLLGQLPPKVQIPFHFVESEDNKNDHSGSLLTNDNAHHLPAVTTQSTTATTTTTNTTTRDEGAGGGGGGWKVRCPFDFTDKRKIDAGATTTTDAIQQLHGIERITRHPGLWSFGLVALGHGLLVPSIPQKAFLCMPATVALLGGSHSDSRHRRGLGGTLDREYDEVTSNVPFYAMLSKRQGNEDVAKVLQDFWVNEVKQTNALLAMGVSALWVLMKGRGVVGAKMKLLPLRWKGWKFYKIYDDAFLPSASFRVNF